MCVIETAIVHCRLSVPQRRGDLSRKLLLRLNISDGPHFYNLAALESTLICLSHITSRCVISLAFLCATEGSVAYSMKGTH